MQAFLLPTGLVALAEIGDKTQLLSLVLAARFRRPWLIVAGILVATLANHALAAAVGEAVAVWLGPQAMRWIVGLGFVAMAAWTLVPDKLDEDAQPIVRGLGVFLATTLAFFMAEMGDKTQLATVALAAEYRAYVAVVAGTTLGMMLANVPVVFASDALMRRISLMVIRRVAAAVFAALGLYVLLG